MSCRNTPYPLAKTSLSRALSISLRLKPDVEAVSFISSLPPVTSMQRVKTKRSSQSERNSPNQRAKMHNLQLLFFGLVSMCVAGRVHPRFKKRTETVIMGLGRNQQPLGPSPKPLQLIAPQCITHRVNGFLDGICRTGTVGLV